MSCRGPGVFSVFFGFVVLGAVDVTGIARNYVSAEFGLSDGISSLIPAACFLWFLLLALPSGAAAGRFSRRTLCIAAMLLCAAALALPSIFPGSLAMTLPAFALLGVSLTPMFVAFNPLVRDAVGESRLSGALLVGQGLKSATAIAIPLLFALIASSAAGWRGAMLCLAAVSVIGALLLCPAGIQEEPSAPVSLKSALALLREPRMLVFWLAAIVLVASDVSVMTRFPQIVQLRTGASLDGATMLVTIYPIAKTLVAFAGAALLLKVDEKTLFRTAAALALLGLAGLLLLQGKALLVAALFVFGLGYSNLFSIIFSRALKAFPDRSDTVSALMIMSLVGGAFCLPLPVIAVLWIPIVILK